MFSLIVSVVEEDTYFLTGDYKDGEASGLF